MITLVGTSLFIIVGYFLYQLRAKLSSINKHIKACDQSYLEELKTCNDIINILGKKINKLQQVTTEIGQKNDLAKLNDPKNDRLQQARLLLEHGGSIEDITHKLDLSKHELELVKVKKHLLEQQS
jgi:hypothetical protein